MSDRCRTRNPLVRDGTSQAARTLAALDPAHAPVDGRDVAGWLEYLRRLARYLRFHDPEGRPAGDWTPFIERDASVIAAEVASWDAQRERRALMADAAVVARGEDPDGARRAFRRLLDRLFALALRIDRARSVRAEGLAFPETLRQHVRGGLHLHIRLLIGMLAKAQDLKLLAEPAADAGVTAEQVLSTGLGTDWWSIEPGASWQALVRTTTGESRVFGQSTETTARRLARAVEYLLPVVEDFARAVARTSEAAQGDLRRTLTDWPWHEPPMALVLAFLQLFRHARQSLDELTGKHLEYHYCDVLGLRPRGAAADRAYVVFQLTRQAEPQVLPAGAVVLAGKDGAGRPLRYALEEELRVSPAAVGAFRTVHRTRAGITAALVADSADGRGAPLLPGKAGWPMFGSAGHGAARIGLAVASPLLLLSGGARTVVLTLTLAPLPAAKPTDPPPPAWRDSDVTLFRAELTAAKAWTPATVASATLRGDALELRLVLGAASPPVTAYDGARHEGSLDTTWPVCRVLVDTRQPGYGVLAGRAVAGVDLTVEVRGAPGLEVVTESGRVNPAKPCMPFGPQPLPGSHFSVRCSELADKPITALSLDLEWLEPGSGKLDEHYAAYLSEYRVAAGLRDLFKVTLSAGSGDELERGEPTTMLPAEGSTRRMYTAKLPPGAVDTIRVEFVAPAEGFGHRLYPRLQAEAVQGAIQQALDRSQATTIEQLIQLLGQVMSLEEKLSTAEANRVKTACEELKAELVRSRQQAEVASVEELALLLRQAIARDERWKGARELQTAAEKLLARLKDAAADVARGRGKTPGVTAPPTPPALPKPPMTARLSGLALTYTARTTVGGAIAGEDPKLRFYHYHPFGETPERPGPDTPLLPRHADEGELYIGLTGARPQERLHLLVHLAEGTGNASIDPPPVTWAYLGADGAFRPLTGEALVDGTRGLVRSGLLTVLLPGDAAAGGTRMPAGSHWLRASVGVGTNVFGEVVAVHAQAARVVLLEPEQHAAHLARPLAPGCLQKLERSPLAIKKVSQPLASFGGRAPETARSPEFMRRVSERLRHKQRAITPHDYETLALEAFPTLHKVRCLNHTRPAPDGDREASPGSVTLVIIPRLAAPATRAPFTSVASPALLTEVKEFLAPLAGPWVRLHVVNPLYETVRLAFGVRFARGGDPALLKPRLREELDAFLSPWAFAGQEAVFGGTLHRSTLMGFVGGRPYVDYVTDFRVRRVDPPGDATDDDLLAPRSARGVLASAGDHEITVLEEPT